MIPGRKPLVFEEGLQSAWLYETLSPHVDESRRGGVTESRGRRATSAMRMAWPRSCAWGTSRSMSSRHRASSRGCGSSRGSHMTLVGDVVRVQARMKSLYRSGAF